MMLRMRAYLILPEICKLKPKICNLALLTGKLALDLTSSILTAFNLLCHGRVLIQCTLMLLPQLVQFLTGVVVQRSYILKRFHGNLKLIS